eukprot:TRINITY_DN64074_c0_g1_i1.p1 TRINITY_DN64074_c0_g1~~TRINITY_DN64074_c0_g1_i1.p1  ORF type:complete len:198 (+),score=46.15 TRINITY_DN64074_c0_g1_i1:95-688(+)
MLFGLCCRLAVFQVLSWLVDGFHEAARDSQEDASVLGLTSTGRSVSVDDDFHHADINGDERLSEEEAKELLEGTARLPHGFRWRAWDADGDNALSLVELRALAAGVLAKQDELYVHDGPLIDALAERARGDFHASDLDGSGFLEREEADALMLELFGHHSILQWTTFDANQDGKLSEKELVQLAIDHPVDELSEHDF